jgi:signal transduction histidine kinase
VTVRDTGVGIADSDQDRIFEAFQRGDRRASVEGTGLGLTLSKRFVELHGGRVWLESALGEGSTFGFAIPAAPR